MKHGVGISRSSHKVKVKGKRWDYKCNQIHSFAGGLSLIRRRSYLNLSDRHVIILHVESKLIAAHS